MNPAVDSLVGSGHDLYVMIGDPVSQAATPALFNAYCANHEIAAVMVGLRIATRRDLSTLIDLWRSSRSLSGLVSTLPFKNDLAELVDLTSNRAARLDSVNCVRMDTEGRLEGEMLDGVGFLAAARKHGFSPNGASVLIVGAGAAGRAIAAALDEAEVASLSVIEPNETAFRHLARILGSGKIELHRATGQCDLSGFDLIINASPLGMRTSDPLPIAAKTLHSHTLVADCVTNTATTPLLEAAQTAGCEIQRGTEMASGQLPLMLAHFQMLASERRDRQIIRDDAIS